MTRRRFLKTLALSAAAIASVAAPSSLSANVRAAATNAGSSSLNGAVYAGTNTGRILSSRDGGKSWSPNADFGSHCSVLSVVRQQEQLVATIAVRGFTFMLASSDGHVWRTVA
jgi:hypothetical protein